MNDDRDTIEYMLWRVREENAKLARLLRAACSTLESQHVPEGMWSGELRRWRREDLRTVTQEAPMLPHVQLLRLRPNDALVLTVRGRINSAQATQMTEEIQRTLNTKCRVLILQDDMQLSVAERVDA